MRVQGHETSHPLSELDLVPDYSTNGRRAPHGESDYVRGWLGRIYPDAVLSGLCFFLLTLSLGKVWRVPFDDETTALRTMLHFNPIEMWKAVWGVGYEPPLHYSIFSLVFQFVPDLAALRLFALICSTLSIFIFHQLFLTSRRDPEMGDRIIAFFAFATIPLLLQWGDAIRWYPIFTFVFALLIVSLVRYPNAIWVPAGLLMALSFLNIEGYLITAAVWIYRYALERRHILRDLKFVTISALFQILPLPYYYKILTGPALSKQQQHGYSAIGLRDYYDLVVGFLDGYTFGIGLIWVILPILAVVTIAVYQLIRRFRETDAVERLALVILGLTAAWATLWVSAYSFIYAALLMTYLVLKVFQRSGSPSIKMAIMFAFLLTSGAALGNLQGSDHPFFRTLPAPYREMAAAISRNFMPGDLVVSTDPNVVTLLDARVDCVRLFNSIVRSGADCPLRDERAGQPNRRPTHLFLVEGRSGLVKLFDQGKDLQGIKTGEGTSWENIVKGLTANRQLVASIPYKYDADAALKNRLSGEKLDPFVFWIKIFE